MDPVRCIRVFGLTRDEAERVAAEAYEAGALGLEERDENGATTLLLYAVESSSAAVARAMGTALGSEARIDAPIPVAKTDWSEAWKAELRVIPVSSRLVIRPSFVAHRLEAGQQEVVIDPGQAFGTGGHVSTQLALEWIDALARELKGGGRVLDVGVGSGVLSLAALKLGWSAAVGVDLDPLATEAARSNARANGLSRQLRVITGGLDAIADGPFELVVANLLQSELLPLLGEIARLASPGGSVVLSGLLARDVSSLTTELESLGFRRPVPKEARDSDGILWSGLLTGH